MRPQAVPTQPKQTPLASIKAQRLDTPWLMLIYGMPGVGKSTLASKIPGAIFICAETHGADELAVSRYPDRIGDLPALLAAIERLRTEPHDFKTLVIDKIDDVEQWIFSAVLKRDKRGAETIGLAHGGYNKGYEASVDEWRKLANALERLHEDRGMGVVLLAHAVRRKFKNPQGSDYQRWEPNVHELASNFLVGWCKEVLFAEEEGGAAKDDATGKIRGFSTGVRYLRTRYHAAYHAKNRHNLPDPLPLDYEALAAAMRAQETDPPEVVTARIAGLLEQLADADVTKKVNDAVAAAKGGAAELAVIENRVRATVRAKKGE